MFYGVRANRGQLLGGSGVTFCVFFSFSQQVVRSLSFAPVGLPVIADHSPGLFCAVFILRHESATTLETVSSCVVPNKIPCLNASFSCNETHRVARAGSSNPLLIVKQGDNRTIQAPHTTPGWCSSTEIRHIFRANRLGRDKRLSPH